MSKFDSITSSPLRQRACRRRSRTRPAGRPGRALRLRRRRRCQARRGRRRRTPRPGSAWRRCGTVCPTAAASGRPRQTLREADTPGQVLTEVVGLIGDHQRALARAARPGSRRAGDARVGHDDAVEPARRARGVASGASSSPSAWPPAPTDASAAPSGRRSRRRQPPAPAARAGELERRARLAGPRRGGDQERPLLPVSHRGKRALLPSAQAAAAARPWSLCGRH